MSRRRERGYTLLEVIIAFGVLALALTLLLGILTNSGRQVRWSGDAGRAALLAQSLLEEMELDGRLREGLREGRLDGDRYRWRLQVRPWRDPGQPAQALRDPAAPRLLEVELALAWADGGPRETLVLRSLRLIPAGVEALP
jgi:general secretion pathway protein I